MTNQPVLSVHRRAHPRVVLVGGVPGAGKTTAMGRLARASSTVTAIDPDEIRQALGDRFPSGTPYRLYRPMVHVAHTLRALAALLRGPVSGRTLVVHDPATRPSRRHVFAWLARRRGWDPVLVYVDVSRSSARAGQIRRGRVVRQSCFEGHWHRWESLRHDLSGDRAGLDSEQWAEVVLVERDQAAYELLRVCRQAPVIAAAA